MNSKGREIADAIKREVENWPDASVEIVEGGKHPKAKLKFAGQVLSRTFAGTPSDSAFAVHQTLGDIRRSLRQLGAERSKPDPTREEDEAPYRKPNDGAAKRPHPVQGEKAKSKADIPDQMVEAGVATTEQAEAARRPARIPEAGTEPLTRFQRDARAIAARLEESVSDDQLRQLEERIASVIDRAAEIVDGVYFGLPEDVYHAVPRISASGLQNLCVSPATFWADSWLNPEKLIAEPDEGATVAQVIGKAYHCARLEPERFDSAYCRKPDKEDYAGTGLLTSDAAVKAALKELGEQQTCTGESNEDRARRLQEAGHTGPIWSLVMEEFESTRDGRVPIPAKTYDQIKTDMERLRETGEIAELLTDGAAEVSVFWTDQHGIKCKCRFDYLTVAHWTDLKTFANSQRKPVEQAIADAVRFNRYHITGVHYREGAEALRIGGLDIVGEATGAQRDLVAQIRLKTDELACWFVFQEKGGVPNLLAREFPFYDVPLSITSSWDTGADEEAQARGHEATRRRTGLHARGHIDIMHAKDQFVLYSNAYDPGTPWFPLNARQRFSDLDFNQYWLEGKV